MGCKGWNYDTLLPYFKKLENCDVPNRDLKYRGVGGTFALSCLLPYMLLFRVGPVSVSEARKGDINPVSRAFIAAAQEVSCVVV